jgi:hypothetical protein
LCSQAIKIIAVIGKNKRLKTKRKKKKKKEKRGRYHVN